MKTRFIIIVVVIGAVFYLIGKMLHIQQVKKNADPPDCEILLSLNNYHEQLAAFRSEYRAAEMPDCTFFLFGMGNRTKLIYTGGVLRDALSGEILKDWQVTDDVILPNEYSVCIKSSEGEAAIYENEDGIFIREGDDVELIPGSDTPVKLPDFDGHPYSEILKVLNHEILVNILDSKPVPNFFVYNKPWRRDAAMMAMCLDESGNLGLIRDWVLGLSDPYDRNNAGVDWKHDRYPYIGWASDHFHSKKRNPISNRDYPLTWETLASQADYEGMAMVDEIYVNQKTSVPHTWHAAEVFLYLIDNGR